MNMVNEGELKQSDGGVVSKIPSRLGELNKTITMAQIAETAGVSQGAISSLLNDRDYGIRVSEKTRDRVFRVCREMGYVPNDLRALVRMYPELGDFCLLLSSENPAGLRDPAVMRMAAAAMRAVPDPAHPLSFAFFDTHTDYIALGETLPQPIRSGTYSKFLSCGSPNPSLFESLHRRGLPAVSLGHDVARAGVLSILADYAGASRLAITHLAQHGHTRIGIVSGAFGTANPVTLELNRGVRLASEELALPNESIVCSDLSFESGRRAFDDLWLRKPEPTAIFCMSDAAAAGVLDAAQARGVSVPAALSIIGCSDDSISELTHPRLTTVHLPLEEMAELGIKEVERMIREGSPDSSQKTLLPARLVERESCAQAADSTA